MASLYHQYYDRIYAGKDYAGEVGALLQIAGKTPGRVLDVGCGTGTHALLLAEAGCAVHGLDLDEGAIEIAKSKAGSASVEFQYLDVAELDDREFDCSVSLFNVVNYLGDAGDLVAFFRAIHDRLIDGAPYIFDCWNGLAALLDPPREKKSTIESGDETITIDTVPATDRMGQTVRMTNCVTITSADGQTRSFNYDYDSFLWTPWHLRSVLAQSGFAVDRVATWGSPDTDATEDDWKVLFICRKEKR